MKLDKPTIIVFGATGTVGAEVLKLISKKHCFVRGVLRVPERKPPITLGTFNQNISYVSADLNSKDQLRAICKRGDAIFLLTATSPSQIIYETNIIEVAEELGIKRVVKLSAPVVPNSIFVEVSDWHRRIERVLQKSTLDYCLLQPHSFMQNWERNTFTIKYLGKIFGVMGDAERNYVDARDVAEVAVKYLLKEEILHGEAIVITGPEALSNASMAERISYVIGKKVMYEDISREEFLKQLTKKARMPEWLARHLVEIDLLAQKHPEPKSDTIESILNRKPRIMNAYLQESREKFLPKKWMFFR
ncbi:Uncharacterized conserved protein YbjT, contains NAD(P)-binding and DUF2867 domains [Tenacibaculum sp. MAR_2009_124]|uniref:NmrA family NAD(P)-binding protein n=1 Tax=Tenacibaculum sp. MAR_2009_124 TaxID=1250059 RepID=UPI000899A8C2|nr:NmrA family NAD(P)-binding protein [Tenacibaculum sp. MAR_2009_124]SEB82617.1 Uncharacterized conserved protein YbjT, contains NAD(P)-binding and DUF2867 domains [Tenacibaculum sp. MAR_2009_124]